MNTKAHQIATAALAIEPERREAWLRDRCGDDTLLRAEVDDQLAHQLGLGGDQETDIKPPEPTDAFLPSFVEQTPPSERSADPWVGQTVGAFQIQRLIGKGGMGNVYLATRSAEFKQRVAIKVLKRGMDTDEILQRFRREIRVLAALGKHPHIAGLLDAGTTPDGLPFLVMEYVEGTTIDRFCDQHRLTIDDRLHLFCRVCDAVHFAHQHTIVHRDLKPSNILVSADGVPKLIDFGISKLTCPELGAETAVPTRTELRLLTPEYASPEQFRGDSITTATDVYSLGVVLYELLTGRRPFADVPTAALLSGRVPSDRTPERPSTSVRRIAGDDGGKTLQDIGVARAIPHHRLHRLLQGDLDTIVLKAMRNEPNRRYASAEQLTADIERHLRREPVQARPMGPQEKMWRSCQRHPILTSLLVATITASLIGLGYLSQLSVRLVRRSALEGAAQQSQMIEHFNSVYADVVREVETNDPLAVTEGRIRLPATVTMDLGTEVRANQESGMDVHLFSEYPFPPRKGGPQDDFQRESLKALQSDPNQPFYRFEEYQGQPSLRYATARVMNASCLDCHNRVPNKPPGGWHVGDVRGVLEIVRPLDNEIADTRAGLRRTFLTIAALFMGVTGTVLAVLLVGRRERTS